VAEKQKSGGSDSSPYSCLHFKQIVKVSSPRTTKQKIPSLSKKIPQKLKKQQNGAIEFLHQ
jgi:hypothetical protein